MADLPPVVDGTAPPVTSKYQRDPQALKHRMNRIEGQVRGIQRMIDEDRYCVDILNQLAAAQAAMREVGLILLEGHMQGCVAGAIQSGQGKDAIEELMGAVRRLCR